MTELYISIGAGVIALVVAAFLFRMVVPTERQGAKRCKRLAP